MAFVEDAYPNLLFSVDGEVYDLDGYQTIVMGGAYTAREPLSEKTSIIE